MADNATVDTSQADATTDTSSQADKQTSTSDQASRSQQDYEKIIADLRKENAAARVKAKELDDLQRKLENDKLSEQERLQKQVADLQKAHDAAIERAKSLERSTSVTSAAAKLGFADPEDAIKLLGTLGDDADVDGLLKELLKTKPYLAGQPQRASSGGATNPARSQSQASTINEEFVRNLLNTPEGQRQYAKMSKAQRDEVQGILLGMNRGR